MLDEDADIGLVLIAALMAFLCVWFYRVAGVSTLDELNADFFGSLVLGIVGFALFLYTRRSRRRYWSRIYVLLIMTVPLLTSYAVSQATGASAYFLYLDHVVLYLPVILPIVQVLGVVFMLSPDDSAEL